MCALKLHCRQRGNIPKSIRCEASALHCCSQVDLKGSKGPPSRSSGQQMSILPHTQQHCRILYAITLSFFTLCSLCFHNILVISENFMYECCMSFLPDSLLPTPVSLKFLTSFSFLHILHIHMYPYVQPAESFSVAV